MEDNTPFVEAEVVEYSSISVWAVLALILAIVSPLVFVSPLLMVLALASCFLAMVAVLKIRSSGGTLSGTALARWATALAVVCMVAAPVRATVREHLLLKQADKAAQHWLALLAEDQMIEAVRNLASSALERLAGPLEPDESHQLTLQQLAVLLRNDPLTSRLVALPKNPDSKKNSITLVSNSPPRGWSIQLLYEVSDSSSTPSSAKPQWVAIDLRKQVHFEGQDALWLIADWTDGLSDPTEQAR